MAKIIGIFDFRQKNNLATLGSMAKPLNLFFRYKKNYLKKGSLALGYLSLDGEDNETSRSEDKRTLVLFSGYLLDFNGSQSPAEFVFKLFRKNKKNFHQKLNGIFNIIIYEKENDVLTIVNDRYGVLPLYYYQDKNKFVFASEVKAIAGLKDIDRQIDWTAWSDYFSFRYVLGSKTFFKNIKSLSNASIIEINNKKINLHKYWDYSEIKIDKHHTQEYFLKKGKELIKNSISNSSKGMKKAICFLSGGYDSRYLAAGLKKYTNINFETFTTEHPTGKKDFLFAKKVAQKLGVRNFFIKHPKKIYQKYFLKKNFLLDGMAQEHLWALPLTDHFKKTEIVFDGLAGDLFLKGLFLDNYNLSFVKNNKKLTSVIADQYGYNLFFIKKFFKDEIKRKLVFSKNILFNELKSIPSTENKISIFFAKNRTKNALCLLSNNLFPQLTKRFPFLDNNLIDFALSVPPEMKINQHLYEEMIKEGFPDLIEIPTTNDVSFLKRLDKFFWDSFTKLRLQKIIKTFLKNYLFRKQLKMNDIKYLFSLLNQFDYPDFIDRKRIKNYIEKKRFDFAFFEVIEFLSWYNLFILGKKVSKLSADSHI